MSRKLDWVWIAAVAVPLALSAGWASADQGQAPPGSPQDTDPKAPKPPPPPVQQPSPSLADLQAQIDQADKDKADWEQRTAALQKMYDGSASSGTVAGSTTTAVAASTNVVAGQMAGKGPKIPMADDVKSKDGDSGGGSKGGLWNGIKQAIGPVGGTMGMTTMLLGIGLLTPWLAITGLGMLVGFVILGAVLDTYT